jgi:hypothetical protein
LSTSNRTPRSEARYSASRPLSAREQLQRPGALEGLLRILAAGFQAKARVSGDKIDVERGLSPTALLGPLRGAQVGEVILDRGQ